MNYNKVYKDLMVTRMSLKEERKKLKKKGDYFERHHIVMKSKGGSNNADNIVYLTAREHFIAHWLLWRIYRDRSSALAFHKMMSKNHLRQEDSRYYSSRGYEEARLAFSITNKGNTHGKRENRKKPHRMQTEEGKLAQSKAIKGTRIGKNNTFYGKKHSESARKLISEKAKERYANGFVTTTNVLVLNTETGIYYDSIAEASKYSHYNPLYVKAMLVGTSVNKTPFIRA